MPPPRPVAPLTSLHSKSTPTVPTRRSLASANGARDVQPAVEPSDAHSSDAGGASPSEPASIDDFSLDHATQMLPSLSPATSDDEAMSDEEDEDGTVPNLPTRPLYQHHYSRSNPYLSPLAFAPPFYNRPPTPLPPSPSLTSLLRPNFSSANSRPTTPDPSSDEGGTPQASGGGGPPDLTGTQTPNSAVASTLTSTYRTAKPIPRASPRVPTYEYYGFTLYLTSGVVFMMYVLWAFLPSPFLHQLGIDYYPDRWWALAMPAWTVAVVVYIYVALAAYNTGYLTLPLDSVECLVDEAASVAVVDAAGSVVPRAGPAWLDGGGGGGKDTGAAAAARQTERPHRKGRGKHGGHSRRSSPTGAKAVEAPALDWRTLWNEGTDAVMDIPVGGVCEILYGSASDGAGDADRRATGHDR